MDTWKRTVSLLLLFLGWTCVAYGDWVRLTNLPGGASNNDRGSATTVGNKVLFVRTTWTVLYDFATAGWTRPANQPTSRHSHGLEATAIDRAISVGGVPLTDKVEEFSVPLDAWATKAALPVARGYMGTATNSLSSVWTAGGGNLVPAPTAPTGTAVNLMHEYQIFLDRWTTKAALPTARQAMGMAYTDGFVVALGGAYADPSLGQDVAHIYNVGTDAWVAGSSAPTPHGSVSSAAFAGQGLVQVVGCGFYLTSGDKVMHRYDLHDDVWTTLDLCPIPAVVGAVTTMGSWFTIVGIFGSSFTYAYALSSVVGDPVFRTLEGYMHSLHLSEGVFNLLSMPSLIVNVAIEMLSTLPPEENLVMTMLAVLVASASQGFLMVDCTVQQGSAAMQCLVRSLDNADEANNVTVLPESLAITSPDALLQVKMQNMAVVVVDGLSYPPSNWLDVFVLPYNATGPRAGLLPDLDARGVAEVKANLRDYELLEGCLFSSQLHSHALFAHHGVSFCA